MHNKTHGLASSSSVMRSVSQSIQPYITAGIIGNPCLFLYYGGDTIWDSDAASSSREW
jgi:hypothetical protein